ncbi:hypothetical protein ACOTU8_08555, partial [Campylobacter jejuni]
MQLIESSILNFDNSGTISSNKGINLSQSNATIDNFSNFGTISGSEVAITTSGKINTFTNQGLIQATGNGRWSNGMWISASATLDTFTNTGTIQSSGEDGIVMKGTINNFTNSGTIKSTGSLEPSTDDTVSSGMFLQSGTIKTLTNEGLISGIVGIKISTSKINTLINTGIIESTSSNSLAAGISIATLSGSPSTINNF